MSWGRIDLPTHFQGALADRLHPDEVVHAAVFAQTARPWVRLAIAGPTLVITKVGLSQALDLSPTVDSLLFLVLWFVAAGWTFITTNRILLLTSGRLLVLSCSRVRVMRPGHILRELSATEDLGQPRGLFFHRLELGGERLSLPSQAVRQLISAQHQRAASTAQHE